MDQIISKVADDAIGQKEAAEKDGKDMKKEEDKSLICTAELHSKLSDKHLQMEVTKSYLMEANETPRKEEKEKEGLVDSAVS